MWWVKYGEQENKGDVRCKNGFCLISLDYKVSIHCGRVHAEEPIVCPYYFSRFANPIHPIIPVHPSLEASTFDEDI